MAYRPPDPLSSNWSYDSAIDLFALNPMLPEQPLPLDLPPDLMPLDFKDFPPDLFAPPPNINGFTISHHSAEDAASLSSDLESDDQSWSPTHLDPHPSSPPLPTRRKPSAPNHYSSSPEIPPLTEDQDQDQDPETNRRRPSLPSSSKRKSSSTDSSSPPSTGNGNGNGRNAAKRAAHNIIEKRYRTNMNAKFVALEKAMAGSHHHNCGSGAGVQKHARTAAAGGGGGASATLKKSEILSNAIAYMQELQEENRGLREETRVLRQGLTWMK